jgi:thermolabile hemolysin
MLQSAGSILNSAFILKKSFHLCCPNPRSLVKKLILLTGLSLLVSIMVFATTSMHKPSDKINQLYVFGDSLSDVGVVFRATGGQYPPNPPYFEGRYSNGQVWIEHLAAQLALTPDHNTNFACGGATTETSSLNGIPGLGGQVQNFVKATQKLDPKGLYVVWAGANDYLYGATNPTIVLENLSQAIGAIAHQGGKKILVANLPDLGQLPATRNNPNAGALSSLTKTHNLGLSNTLNQLGQKLQPDTTLIQLDAYTLYREAIDNPAQFGFTNVMSACLDSSCSQPDQFLFWDGIHPTTAAHRILGERAALALKSKLSLNLPSKKVH